MQKWIITLGLTVAVAACTREAGYEIDAGTFGNATLNNIQVQNGELTYAQILGQRFAADVPSQVNFAFNSSQLDASAQRILLQQADWIKQFPEARFRVYGHTDAVGSTSYNKSLGLRRAQSVVAFLERQGISRSRLEAVVSFGKSQPLIATQQRDRRNRRTVTEVSGFVDGNRQLLDGKYANVIYREYVESATFKSTVQEVTASEGDDG
ncbi:MULTISPECIES: OmpA family protein [unclassified Ruegeria]|uniref:OmpA family protein n=1 Tax=unclassified Ruegeria TaxID=2625375 RepID=UPI00148913B7|nr:MULTISPECIES: OmpA family protein [unclassified Ruegeria]NOD35190.1 OmpA family protein [Ruegeria sp. HKCCD7296]NOD46844.1 OmpA family protein [Ruegeria sp. HKCCD5849]NOD51167.1 OmpA family protein [Ruegeria sp. HKCCD5851]NOD67986.1 OmpA family protein [Ruegeria sp. HKCCD7303]NOE42262.1 OmpA family protein [Ruegeria sp. HKCCD7319]